MHQESNEERELQEHQQDEESNEEQEHKNKDIEFIAQGTYGCVYNTEIQCSSHVGQNKKDEKKYVSKVTASNDLNQYDRENIIGNVVKKINHYEYYFAPILDTCPINIGVIDDEEIDKCEVIAKNENKKFPNIYVSNKMRFVGDRTIEEYLYTRNTYQEIKAIFETHIHLTKALLKLTLQPESIIHYDLKASNIMFDSIQNVPIIIDFGLSFTHTKMFDALLNPENLQSYFYNDTFYAPWSIEIHILSFITINIVSNDEDIDEFFVQKYFDELNEVVLKFTDEPRNDMIFDSEEEKGEFKQKMNEYITSFKFKTIKELIHDLILTWKSWDNYAIAVMYNTYILDNPGLLRDPYIMKYRNLLKKIILTTPSANGDKTRIEPQETYESIIKLCTRFI
jgi:hypothetical protein